MDNEKENLIQRNDNQNENLNFLNEDELLKLYENVLEGSQPMIIAKGCCGCCGSKGCCLASS